MLRSTQIDKKSFQESDKTAHFIVKHTNLKVVQYQNIANDNNLKNTDN